MVKKFTIEEIKELAKNHSNLKEFKSANALAYEYAKLYQIVEDIYPKTPKVVDLGISFEQCQMLIQGIPSRSKLIKANQKLYTYVKSKGWLDNLIPAQKFGNFHPKQTNEQIIADLKNYETKGILKIANPTLYSRAYNKGLLKEVYGERKVLVGKEYTPLEIIEELKKYPTKNQVNYHNPNLYRQAKKLNLLDIVLPSSAGYQKRKVINQAK